GRLRRSHPQGREAGGPGSAGTDQVRIDAQSQNRQGARPRDSGGRARPRRRGDRVISADLRGLMTTFVLVHGAWHGGWCYKRVARLLRQAGHEVYTPTLTGLGERAHLMSRTIDLGSVVLCGHSYGGMVIAGV